MPQMYYCTVCKKRHRTGKIYQDHLKHKKSETNQNRVVLLSKLSKINRKIMYGNYNKDGKEFLKGLRREIEVKLK